MFVYVTCVKHGRTLKKVNILKKFTLCLVYICWASHLINSTREYEPHFCSQTIRDSFEYQIMSLDSTIHTNAPRRCKNKNHKLNTDDTDHPTYGHLLYVDNSAKWTPSHGPNHIQKQHFCLPVSGDPFYVSHHWS